MHVSYIFAEAELVKAALRHSVLTIDFIPKDWQACIVPQAS